MKTNSILRLSMLATAASLAITTASSALADDVVLTMAVPDWPPTRVMKDLFDEHYQAPSGATVRLEVDFIPWPDFYTRLNASLTSGEQRYTMAVSDSQWLGAFTEGGYYRPLNDLVDDELQAALDGMHRELYYAYSTYPYKSDTIIGFPQMPDILVTYARSDVLCHEAEQAAFMEQFGEKLPCTPEELDDMDWDMFGKIGQFFQREAGDELMGETLSEPFYGISYQAGKGYDFSSMQINGFIWQHGGDIWDETGIPNAQAEGVVNSPEAVAGLEHYLTFLQYMPPVVQTGSMDIFVTDELFREGRTALNVNWIGFAESVIDPEASRVADNVVFANPPGLRGEDGEIIRWQNIGGQPFVIMNWATDEQVSEAVDFVKWWLTPETQHMYAARGGQSAITEVYEDPQYNTYRPWNRTWAQNLDWQKDVWHIPQFFEMLVQQQDEFDLAITGQQDAQTTLDNIARFQQRLLEDEGLIQ